MGCWNKTCGISQFPISYGSSTVNFILVETEYAAWRQNMPSHITDMGWRFIPIPFYGKYDDYGWQEDDGGQQPKYDFLAQHYKDNIVPVEREKERAKHCYPDLELPFDNSKSLDSTIHGNVWNIGNSCGGNTFKLASFMLDRIVWDKLTTKMYVDYPNKRWYTREEIAESLQKFIDYKANKTQNMSENELYVTEVLGSVSISLGTASLRNTMLAEAYVQETFKNNSYMNPLAMVIYFCYQSRDHNSVTAFSPQIALEAGVITVEDVAAMFMMNSCMHSLRKPYQPQTCEGSQSDIDYAHGLLVEAMQDIIARNKSMYDEDDDNYEEDEEE